MNTRYLEIVSAFRDRNLYPNPAQFDIEISQSGTKDRVNALDPVCISAPVLSFSGSFNNAFSSPTIIITGIKTATAGQTNTASNFLIESKTGELREEKDYYMGAVIELTDGLVTSRNRISSYTFLGNIGVGPDIGIITIIDSVPISIIQPGTTGSITNPTETNLSTLSGVFLPFSTFISNYYINTIVSNETRGEYRKVTFYDGVTHIVGIDSMAPSWQPDDYYIIRHEPPCNQGTLTGIVNSTTFKLGPGASNENNIYIGGFLRIAGPIPNAPFSIFPAPFNENRRIVNYNGQTQTATITPPFSVLPGLVDYEVLGFSYDNVVPFTYTGSNVSQQEMVCYEIELLNLVLPNKVLKVSTGGRIAFYPYVYVELQNVSASGAGLKNIIYSNNPYSTRMLFRCAIDDIPNPLSSPYVKIDSDGMTQTVKFKINDNLRFSVHLPNGELFQTVDTELFGPNSPNDLIQVSALFSLKRL
jgi:hypothetical protein